MAPVFDLDRLTDLRLPSNFKLSSFDPSALIKRIQTRTMPAHALQNSASRTSVLLPRAAVSQSAFPVGGGSADPFSFNGPGFIALFAILGAGMSLASLWFFFWAKNGGFHFRKGDWDDYKSTVLRRKGPDGRTLSNATKSTKLGGMSIAGTQQYRWAKQYAQSVVGRDEKGRKGVRAKRGWGGTHSMYDSDASYMTETIGTKTVSDMTEIREEHEERHEHRHGHEREDGNDHSKRYRDRDVQQYKREKPARVGGLNRVADGSDIYGTGSACSEAMTEASDRPMLPKPSNQESKERAERKAREEAAKMERRWRREAEEAAAALAREVARFEPPRRSAAPAPKPMMTIQRHSSPARRDFSYNSGPASEILSTTSYSADQRTERTASSYYDSYRPNGPVEAARLSPKKVAGGIRAAPGGYRRGADDDFD